MISFKAINSCGKTNHGAEALDYLMAVEYYVNGSGEKQETTRYGGKLAADPMLDLEGKAVSREVLLQLAKGFSPTGEPLCQNAGAQPREVVKRGPDGNPRLDKEGNPITKMEGGHKVGYDLTFSAPKPFSLAFAIAEGEERDKILDAHRKAVAVSMGYLEDKVETRRGKNGRDVIGTQGLIYMQADHLSSRSGDCQVHTHTLCFAVSKGVDGKWGAYDSREITRHRVAADAIYKNELAANMRELGYGIQQERALDADGKETGRVHYKINGISDELCETFSKRRTAILAYQEEHGVDAQTACLATRRHKDEPSYAEMTDLWKRSMAAMPEGSVPTIEELKSKGDVLMQAKSDAELLEKLHETQAVVSDHQLIDLLGQENAGMLRYPELLAKVEAFKQSTGMVAIEGERLADEDKGKSLSRRQTETRYAAPWMVDWENEIVHRVDKRKDEEHQKVPKATVDKVIENYQERKGFTLSDEQRKAVEHLTSESGGVALLQGYAGTGKTTVSSVYSEIFQAQGRRMLGVCVANDAAKKLEHESGMPCMSVSMMLARIDRGKMTLTDNDVLVVDEAGMLGTNQTRQLLTHAEKARCKVVLQGDLQQIQPIEAGSGMSLANMAVGSARLTEVRRQKNEEDRELVLAYYNRDKDGNFTDLKKGTRSARETREIGGKILAALDKKGAIDDFDSQPQAIAAMVDDYLKHPAAPAEKLVLAHKRVEVAALNEAIRNGLKEQGLIDKQDAVIRAKENGEFTDLPMARGDRVRFSDGNRELGVINGSKGIVIGCRENDQAGGVDLKVQIHSPIEKENGRIVSFNSNDFASISHDFATTVHKAQGASKEEVFHLASPSMMDAHSSLVAFSRLTKGSYRLYGTTDEIDQLKDRFGMERLKETAREAGLKREEPKQDHGLSAVEHDALAQAAKRFVERLGTRREHRQEREQEFGASL